MGTFSSNILPNTSGLDLGASNQLWDAFVRNLNFTTAISNSVNPSQSGTIRLAAADTATIRNFANTQDLNLFSKNVNDVLAVGGPAGVSLSGPLTGSGSIALGTLSISNTTISNATVVGNGNNVSLLNVQGPLGPLVGNSSDQVLYTYSLPAGTLRNNTGIRICAMYQHSTGSASVTYRINFGGTDLSNNNFASTNTFLNQLNATVFNNNSTTAQWSYAEHVANNTFQSTAAITPAINTGNAVTITVTFNVANTDQVKGLGFYVELVQ